ncbi:MAG: sulfoxide reductase heme-binding subunit YedZ [Pseudomonadales bacterium]|nr:sulfoxide reductase heme-binding subunit YedZ [Pseudomonadales bacterium]
MRKFIKPAVFLLALVPFVLLFIRAVTNDLGPDPAQELSIETGEWTLRFLLITLALTPLRQITGQAEFVRHRRMLGLFALFYATVHFLCWMTFIFGFRWFAFLEELIDRPYIAVGFTAWVILVALGVTSPKVMVRKLGKNWKRLHRLVYIASILGVIHLLWILRADIGEAVLYGSIVFVLLGYRLARYLNNKRTASG